MAEELVRNFMQEMEDLGFQKEISLTGSQIIREEEK